MSSNSPEAASPSPRKDLFESCWGCRILSGLGLIGAGVWVYLGPRRVMQQRIAPSQWHIVQMTFALSLATWGIVVMVNPVGKLKPKKE